MNDHLGTAWVPDPDTRRTIAATVRAALAEDLGDGDLSAALLPASASLTATVVSREEGVLCGQAWAEEAFRQLDPALELNWQLADGAAMAPGATLLVLRGPARAILSGERTALNFLQTLSGTATASRMYHGLRGELPVTVLDTRKTLPGLRHAQKYAVRVGGCANHRMGLFDAFLIKENHIRACGGITVAVQRARAARLTLKAGIQAELAVEVRSLAELREAIEAGADTALLDNFALEDIREAVRRHQGQVVLEVSGGITAATLPQVAATGIDRISIGALTKHCRAIDMTLLAVEGNGKGE